MLFLQGDAPDAVYVVRDGLVRIFLTGLDGTETTVRLVGSGEVFGELAVIDGGTRSAGAIALRDVTALRIPATLLAAELPPTGSVGRSALRGLVTVVRENTRRMVNERAPGIDATVARVLLDDPGILGRVTQGELAGLIGVSRQSLNQVLRRWESEGIIVRSAGVMEVAEAAILRRRHG